MALLFTTRLLLLTALRCWSGCCSYSVWLCGLYYGAVHVLKSSRALLFSCFFIPLSIVITLLGEEGAGLCASRAVVCLFCTC